MERSWLDAIKKVLGETEAPLHYTEISEQVLSRGYYVTKGATPAATVNAMITESIKHDGERSPFIKVGRGPLHCGTRRQLQAYQFYLSSEEFLNPSQISRLSRLTRSSSPSGCTGNET